MDTTKDSVYIKHYGLLYRVMAVFQDDDKANEYMEKTEGASVLDERNGNIYIVHKDDCGRNIPDDWRE
jgi:hypothetical protein